VPSQPGGSQAANAPSNVAAHADEFFARARSLVGDRFGEARFDPDRGLRVTIVDLDDQDLVAITTIAQRLTIADWVRIEDADPTDLQTWERLRRELIRLQDSRPGVLQRYPTPDPGYRRPPVEIQLAADAQPVAADLHATYGTFVSLRLGALPYPPGPGDDRARQVRQLDMGRRMETTDLRVELDGALSVRSGADASHRLLISNLTQAPITIHTSGYVSAEVVDPSTGAVVGGSTKPSHAVLVPFTVEPGDTIRVPLLVGTESFQPHLGYALPPGQWALIAYLDLHSDERAELRRSSHRTISSRMLPFTIT
jgi:hypothetical protein